MNGRATPRSPAGASPRLTAILLIILAAGALLAWSTVTRANREMRASLLQQTRLVAQAVNVEAVRALSGTEADLLSPVYRRLKEQLAATRSANPQCRFVYLVGRQADGTVFFFGDSEPAGSKDYSPPGQVYDDASAELRRVFDARAAVVEGPVADPWGTWVSALVPVTDPATGAVVAVLGMDIDARAWKWDVAARSALPVGLMLVLLIGAAAVFVSARRVDASPRPVLRRLLLPLAVMVILLLSGAGALLWRQQQEQIAGSVAGLTSEVSRELRLALEQQTVGLTTAAQPIAAAASVHKALRDGDADRLLAAWRPVLETLQRENHLTHLSFLDTNRMCLLRVHAPEERGDRNAGFTALEAERTGKAASGLELGPPSTLTLKVVQPVFEGRRLIGYVELGKEIEDVLRALHIRSGDQLAVVIHKQHLDRQTWEEGRRRIDREADWDRLPRSVVIYASQGRLPDAFAAWADQTADELARHEIAFDGKDWRVSATPIQDASSAQLGNLLVMHDITPENAAFSRLVVVGGTAGAVLLTLLLGFIYILLRRTDAGIRAQQEALRASESRMRSITDSAQDAILMMDPEGRVSFWNPAAERMLGYTRAEALGQNLHSRLAPARYQAAHQAAFSGFRLTGQGAAVGKTLDLEARRKDGTEISVQLSLSALQLNGRWHAVGLLRDITERKQAEEALRETNSSLAAAMARATSLAAEAAVANAAKSEFLANMSHEIRTPLNGVIGMTGLLLDSELNEEQRRHAEIVRASGESLLSLINDILDFSKLEAKKLDLETLDFDLHVLLDELAANLALRAHDKGLELVCAAAPDVPVHLRGDPGRLRQVLLNLAGNAVKFTHQGEVAVRVTLVSETDAEAVLRFSVKDTGIGIPAEKQELLFQKFTQADASTTRQYGGTGLGLAISKELAVRMGGEIGVSSAAGRGSEFSFTARLGKQAPRPRHSSPPADLRGAHVLVVDDNATNREVLMAQLAAWGVRAEETPDGPTALQALHRARDRGDPFQAAILDMQMPGMDGAELARAIKAEPALKETRLVLMTSLGQRGDARRMEEIGFAAYLSKPARQSELFGSLCAMLADTPAAKGAPPILTRHTIPELGRSKARILLAEDNITNQQVALGILKKLGLRADAVANGSEAVKALETLPYDLVLMDVQMPEMDGIEATRQIRNPQSAVRNHEIPVIAMTAHAMQGDRERCLEVGMNDYVSKPVSPRSLAEALRRWLPEEAAVATDLAPGGAGDAARFSAPEEEVLVFDRAGLMARLTGDEDLARTVAEIFLDDMPRQAATLRSCLETGDAPGVERQAHTIKGAAASMGGEALRAVARDMEMAGRAGDLAAVAARMADLDTQLARLVEALGKELLTTPS